MSETLNYEVMTVGDSVAKYIDRLCHEPEKEPLLSFPLVQREGVRSAHKGGSVIFDDEVHFLDKHFMVVQVVAAASSAWTQGILFDEYGHECGSTPQTEEFLGTYQVGNYCVTVEKKDD